MQIDYRVYEAQGDVPADKRFFCLPHFALDGKLAMTFFTYGATAEEAQGKAEEFWTAEIGKAQANRSKKSSGERGRPASTMVTPAMLAKIDADYDPKGPKKA